MNKPITYGGLMTAAMNGQDNHKFYYNISLRVVNRWNTILHGKYKIAVPFTGHYPVRCLVYIFTKSEDHMGQNAFWSYRYLLWGGGFRSVWTIVVPMQSRMKRGMLTVVRDHGTMWYCSHHIPNKSAWVPVPTKYSRQDRRKRRAVSGISQAER